MIKATTKVPKVIEFFEIIRKAVNRSCYYGYGDLLLDISRLNIFVEGKKESINVYEEVRKIANQEILDSTDKKNKDVLKRIAHIASLRISYLKGEDTSILTYEDALKYFKNFKHYPEIFSEKTLKEVLNKTHLKDFAEIKTVFGNADYYLKRGYLVVGEGIRKKTETRGRWQREVDAYGVDFLVPSQHQLKEKDFLRACLYLEYTYLNKYPITLYHMDNSSYNDFYVEVLDNKGVKKGSLYVPFKALKERNPDLVKDRMTKYFTSYYTRDEAKLKEQLSLMNTKIAKELFNDIKNHK